MAKPTLRRQTDAKPSFINEGTLTGAAKGAVIANVVSLGTGQLVPFGAGIGAIAGSFAHKGEMEREAVIGEETKPPSFFNREALVAMGATTLMATGAVVLGAGLFGGLGGVFLGLAVTAAASIAGKSRMESEYQEAQMQQAHQQMGLQQSVGQNLAINQALSQQMGQTNGMSYKNSASLADINAGYANPKAGGFAEQIAASRAQQQALEANR